MPRRCSSNASSLNQPTDKPPNKLPSQFIMAGVLYFGSWAIEALFDAADVTRMTVLFFAVVFLAATQVGGCTGAFRKGVYGRVPCVT